MIRLFDEADRPEVKKLWANCNLLVPHNDPDEDIDRSQAYANADLFIFEDKGKSAIIGSVFVSHDARRGLVYYLAVDPNHQGQGIGQQLMTTAESWIKQQGMNKVHLFVRATNLKTQRFYTALEYNQSSTVLMEKWI